MLKCKNAQDKLPRHQGVIKLVYDLALANQPPKPMGIQIDVDDENVPLSELFRKRKKVKRQDSEEVKIPCQESSASSVAKSPSNLIIKIMMKGSKETIDECSIPKNLLNDDIPKPNKRASCPRPLHFASEHLVSNHILSRTRSCKLQDSTRRVKLPSDVYCLRGDQMQQLISKAKIELFKHQREEACTKSKAPVKMLSVKLGH